MSVNLNSTTKQIWAYLINAGFSKNGAAGIMGNMAAESGCIPYRKQGDIRDTSYKASLNYTDQVNAGYISKETFMHDEIGYGLCQWTYYSRKQTLYEMTIGFNRSIACVRSQLDLLVSEMSGVLKAILSSDTNSLETCSNAFLELFEKPADIEGQKPIRLELSQEYLDAYKNLVEIQRYVDNLEYIGINSIQDNRLNTLLSIAKKEVGVSEEGYLNKVKYNTWFYGRVVEGSAYPWCMVFVEWCLASAGIEAYLTAGCTPFFDYYKQNYPECVISSTSLMPGDIIFYSNNSIYSNVADHTGIVLENNVTTNRSYKVIEGNTSPTDGSQDNGGTVAIKTRYLDPATLNMGGGIMGGVRLLSTNAFGGSSSTASIQIMKAIEDALYQFGSAVDSRQMEYREFTTKVQVDKVISIDEDPSINRTKGVSLLTTPTFVESPFIMLKIGKYTFGSYCKNKLSDHELNITYPNFMTSINVVKMNGVVNQYTIKMVYQIQAGQDPNMIDKIFSTVGYGTVYISYGDWNAPAFIYKEEEAIITNLTSDVDFANSRITYTLKCTSNSIALMGGYYNFPARNARPSDIITNMLYHQNSTYKLLDIFPGMKNQMLARAKGLLINDDTIVKIEAKTGIDALSYLNYLVSCMSPSGESSDGLRTANYYLTICDDITGEFGGSYFKITKVSSNENTISLDSTGIYEVDVGYPGDTLVTSFNINTNNAWSLLYNYSDKILPENYTYEIDNNGNVFQTSAPGTLMSSKYSKVTESQRSWWSQMTRFPITATLTIKGLLRPALLMSKVRINALFYGQRHTSSGIYVITKQEDVVNANGYRTILSLTRIIGDLDTIQTVEEEVITRIPVYIDNGNNDTEHNTVVFEYPYQTLDNPTGEGAHSNQPIYEEDGTTYINTVELENLIFTLQLKIQAYSDPGTATPEQQAQVPELEELLAEFQDLGASAPAERVGVLLKRLFTAIPDLSGEYSYWMPN